MADMNQETEIKKNRGTLSRRAVVIGGGVGLAGCLLYGFTELRGGRVPYGTRNALGIVRPPGALEEQKFLARCIRCTRCSDVCETNCIQLFGPETGAMQSTPFIVPRYKSCNLCLECGPACPTGAISVLAEIKDADMGEAVVDERLCVSHNGTGVCGACHTICPLKNRALTQGMHFAPTIHTEHCTGCGMCENICIVDDQPAIKVQTARIWTRADARPAS